MDKQTFTKEEMAELMGISVEEFQQEIDNAAPMPMNRAMRRKLGIKRKVR